MTNVYAGDRAHGIICNERQSSNTEILLDCHEVLNIKCNSDGGNEQYSET